MDRKGAREACRSFGVGWDVREELSTSLVCTTNAVNQSCSGECDTWRLLVWEDGVYGNGSHSHVTRAGSYYGGYYPCESSDKHSYCGESVSYTHLRAHET